MFLINLLLAAALILAGPLRAQQPPANAALDDLKRSLDAHQQKGELAEALALFQPTLVELRKTFGESSGEEAGLLARWAGVHQAMGRYGEADGLYQRALAMAKSAQGPEHPGVSFVLNDMATLFRLQGRFSESEAAYQQALDIRQKAVGADHPAVALIVSNLASLYLTQGRYKEAEPLFRRALAIVEAKLKPGDPEQAKILNNLATLYWSLGRFSEAEALFRRSLAIIEGVFGREHPVTATALSNLGLVYQDQGRYGEAEPLLDRALTIREKTQGPGHHDVGLAANNLAWLYQLRKRYADAEPLFDRAIAITEKAVGAAHADVGSMLNNLAVLYRDTGRYQEAEALFQRAIGVREKALGADHSDVGQTAYQLARVYQAVRRNADAEALHRRGLEIRSKALGPIHPDVIQSLDSLAEVHEQLGNLAVATDYARRAREAIVARAKLGTQARQSGSREAVRDEVRLHRGVFERVARLASSRQSLPNAQVNELRNEAFLAAQWAGQTSAEAALNEMAARIGRGSGALAREVRERQDLVAEWQGLDRALVGAVGLVPDKRSTETESTIRERLTALDKRIAEADQKLARDFPDYAATANPEPIGIAAVQAQIGANEALVVTFDMAADRLGGRGATFVWVVTKTDARWIKADLGTQELGRMVATLRCGLDDSSWKSPNCRELTGKDYSAADADAGRLLPFDVALANRLYTVLLGRFEPLLRDKHLIVVPSGPLTQIPWQALVTGKLGETRPDAQLRAVPWLTRRHAITILPAVSALKALRSIAGASAAPLSMIGIGNPLLDGRANPEDARLAARARSFDSCASIKPEDIAALAKRSVRLAGSVSLTGSAKLSDIRRQSPLPETAIELCEVARELGAKSDAILLGPKATEKEIKQLSERGELARHKIIHFATHGTLASEIGGTTEPGLLLTPPETATELDDGYLSASEVAGLKLDADWVILSACNTAAGEGKDAEALSGLARAFFYAQARALLVSHWEVYSEASVKLISQTVKSMTSDRRLGRAGALRRAMLSLIDSGHPQESHPSFWAPFILVGEGGAGR